MKNVRKDFPKIFNRHSKIYRINLANNQLECIPEEIYYIEYLIDFRYDGNKTDKINDVDERGRVEAFKDRIIKSNGTVIL